MSRDKDVLGQSSYHRLAHMPGGVRLHAVLYLLGMVLIFLGERLVGGQGATRWGLDGVGLVLVLASFTMLLKGMAVAPGTERSAHRLGLLFGLVGLAAVGVYALGGELVTGAIGFVDDDMEQRYHVIISALWPIMWLAGTLPFLVVDRALAANPVVIVPGRVRMAAMAGLGVALAIALLFPLNYLAQDMNKRWDFGYFKTARPGTATVSMVESLDEPLSCYLFFPTASDVTEELRTYFDDLPQGMMTVEYVDHALEPELAKDLKIRDNGYIALVRGEGDDQQVEKVKIGVDFDSAKRKLKKLDGEFQKALLKIAKGRKIAYFTVGHGEMYWKSGTESDRKLGNLKKILQAFNYKVKELGLTEGLGNEVPEDADIVFIMGPESDFLPEELNALDAYRRRGGSLLVALEPGGPDVSKLLTPLGARWRGDLTLANDSRFVPRTYRLADRVNIFTNDYSTHESVTTLSRNSRVLFFITPGAGALEEDKSAQAPGNKVTATVKSLPDTWGDLDGDLSFDADTEQRHVWDLVLAASGPSEGAPVADEGDKSEDKAGYRAVLMADASWASDLALPLDPNKANFQMVVDTVAWLGHEADIAGTVSSEEDVKIQHNKEDQGWIFYGTAFLMPFGFLGLGLIRIRLRKKRGAA